MIYLFLPERVKIQKALSHGLVLKKVNINTKFNKKAWLKQYIDTNTELRKKKKIVLEKTFSSWCIAQFLGKPWKMFENIGTLNL